MSAWLIVEDISPMSSGYWAASIPSSTLGTAYAEQAELIAGTPKVAYLIIHSHRAASRPVQVG